MDGRRGGRGTRRAGGGTTWTSGGAGGGAKQKGESDGAVKLDKASTKEKMADLLWRAAPKTVRPLVEERYVDWMSNPYTYASEVEVAMAAWSYKPTPSRHRRKPQPT